MAPDLGNTQKWMQAVILHPGSDHQAVASPRARKLVPASEFPSLIRPSRTLDSFDRIGIYRGMYLARLQEALEADYPGLRHFLGPKRFSDLVRGYVDRYPSQSYTLNRLGDHLPKFIQSSPGIARKDFLYELARFELLMSRLFDAEESPVLTPEAIAAVPPECWETARLEPVAALSVQALRYPVGAYLEAVRQGKPRPSTRRKKHWAVVYRRQYALRWLDLSPAAYRLLHALVNGVPLGEALSGVLRRGRQPVGEVQLFSWFRGWVTEGLFQAVELDDPA
ncbi:MAG: DNA-binding domain-containing protein [Acidobacteriota bacterium]|nr:DNA-binding domain-containing protein [Acidobacteriota bacterium]